MTTERDPTRTPPVPKGRVRRRIFWSMLGVASVALLLAGIVAALVGQNIIGSQTRNEMARQAAAVEGLLGDRLGEDADAARVVLDVLDGNRAGARILAGDSPAGRSLIQLVNSARRLFGSPLVDLAFFEADGTVRYLTESTPQVLSERLSIEALFAGEDQFVNVPAADIDSEVPFLVYATPVPVAGYEDAPVQMAIVVARQRAFIDFGQVLRGLLFAFTVASLLSALFSRLLATRITRRLDGLAAAASALAGGDVSARAHLEGDDEVTEVAASFNAMADQLEDLHVREREFLMSVGHDLRTPLTTIAGYAEVLEDANLGGDETHRIAGVLAAETARLRRLVEDLMLLARLESREFTVDYEEVDVTEHVRELVQSFRPRADHARVRLDLDVEWTGRVETDPDRVAQILGNLLENALRYSPEAGSVSVKLRPVGEEVELSVADSGSGIDAADLPRVFEKFYVARNYRRVRPEGSGLGLSIVKELVDGLGGRVAVTSDVNKGTTVWVRLPMRPVVG